MNHFVSITLPRSEARSEPPAIRRNKSVVKARSGRMEEKFSEVSQLPARSALD
jgi:hypothetical protein